MKILWDRREAGKRPIRARCDRLSEGQKPRVLRAKGRAISSMYKFADHSAPISAEVDQIDADAALLVVRCFFLARGSGGELRFAAARPEVVRPFRATTLDTLLPFDPTVAAACKHFTGGSTTGH